MVQNSTQLNALIFHNQIVLPRTSPGFGEVSLAVAELQGGNYQKAAILAEIAVGKDPQLAAGWLAKTAADVFEATPENLHTDRAVFCLERAVECAPSCRAPMVEFFVSNVVGHYVNVLCAGARVEVERWEERQAQAAQMRDNANLRGALALTAGIAALCSRNFGVKVLGGLGALATVSANAVDRGNAVLLDMSARDHRLASLGLLAAARELIWLAAQSLHAEGLSGDALNPVLDDFTGHFRKVVAAHAVRTGRGASGQPWLDRSATTCLQRVLPGSSKGDLRGLLSIYNVGKLRRENFLGTLTFSLDKVVARRFARYRALVVRGLLGKHATAALLAGRQAGVPTPPPVPGTVAPLPLLPPVQGPAVRWKVVLRTLVLTLGALFCGVILLAFIAAHSRVHAPGGLNTPGASVAGRPATTTGRQPEVRRASAVGAVAPSATSPSALPVPTPAAISYVVTGIAVGDTLNVRTGPGVNNEISARLPNGYRDIQIVGAPVLNGTTPWVQIRFGERTGWVTRSFLKPE